MLTFRYKTTYNILFQNKSTHKETFNILLKESKFLHHVKTLGNIRLLAKYANIVQFMKTTTLCHQKHKSENNNPYN